MEGGNYLHRIAQRPGHSGFGHSSFIRGFGLRHCFVILHSDFDEWDAMPKPECRNPNPRMNEETRMTNFEACGIHRPITLPASPHHIYHKEPVPRRSIFGNITEPDPGV